MTDKRSEIEKHVGNHWEVCCTSAVKFMFSHFAERYKIQPHAERPKLEWSMELERAKVECMLRQNTLKPTLLKEL